MYGISVTPLGSLGLRTFTLQGHINTHSFKNRAAIIVAAFEVQASGEITHMWRSGLNGPV